MLAMCQVPLLLAENSESFVHLTRHSAEEPTYLMLYPCKTRNSPDVMGFRLSGVRSKLGNQTRLAAIRDIPILYRAWPRARSRTVLWSQLWRCTIRSANSHTSFHVAQWGHRLGRSPTPDHRRQPGLTVATANPAIQA
jgi:hypothetical protein